MIVLEASLLKAESTSRSQQSSPLELEERGLEERGLWTTILSIRFRK
jgi:hypothetical protein